jgi:hypothetical protein
MNNDFSLGAFARFSKKPSNRHISNAPICLPQDKPSENIFPRQWLRHAREESLCLLQASVRFSQTLILTLPGAPPKYAAVFWHSRFRSAATFNIHV